MPILPLSGAASSKGALIPLGSTTVTNSSTAEIAFSNIPQGYTNLYLNARVRKTDASMYSNIYITPFYTGLPAQPQSNTFMDHLINPGSNITAGRQSNQDGQFSGLAPAAAASANNFGFFEAWFFNYSNTTNFKPSLYRYAWYSPYYGAQGLRAGLTRATGGITTISVSTFSGSVFLEPGSTATLYGVRGVNQ